MNDMFGKKGGERKKNKKRQMFSIACYTNYNAIHLRPVIKFRYTGILHVFAHGRLVLFMFVSTILQPFSRRLQGFHLSHARFCLPVHRDVHDPGRYFLD